jgi:nucleoside-diphosphate-sugar epimerase
VLVSGASGWLGRNLIELFLDIFNGQIPSNFLFAAATEKMINLHGNRSVKIYKWDRQRIRQFEPTLFIHSAFLTRDKLKKSMVEKYILTNQKITSEAEWALELESVQRMISVSSGAARYATYATPISSDPYGVLKFNEENCLQGISERFKKQLLVVRVHSIMGNYIKTGDVFFVESLINSLIENRNFKIDSNYPVWRSYASAYEMFAFSLLGLVDGRIGLINSGGYSAELRDLAQLAKEVLNSKSEIILPDSNKLLSYSDYYVSDAPDLNQVAGKFGTAYTNLAGQILQTANSILDLK